MSDHYEMLGLQPNASKSDIKNAYFRLAHRYHPDHHAGADAAAAAASFRNVKDAYEVLIDDTLRAEYDRHFSSSSASGVFSSNQHGQYGGSSSDQHGQYGASSSDQHGQYGGASSDQHGQYAGASSTSSGYGHGRTSWQRKLQRLRRQIEGAEEQERELQRELERLRELQRRECQRAWARERARFNGGGAYGNSGGYGQQHYSGSSSSGGYGGYAGTSTASGSRQWHGGGFQGRPMAGGNAAVKLGMCCAAVLLCWGMYKHGAEACKSTNARGVS